MHYKTIVLELLQEQYPKLHDQLRASRTLLSTIDLQAAALKRYHEDRMDQIAQAKPGREESQIASEALELALEDLRDNLPSESATDDDATEPLSLDAAMAFIRNHTPPA
jgi:hypothetical protein